MARAVLHAHSHGSWSMTPFEPVSRTRINMLSSLSLPLQAAEYRPLLTTLFSRYVDPCLEYCRRNFKTVVPLPAVNQVCPCHLSS